MIADICREENKFMVTLWDDIAKLKDASKVILQAAKNEIKNLPQQEEYKGKLDAEDVKLHYEFIGNNSCNDIYGFKSKPWPNVNRKPFEHKNFFARYYACRAGSKTDGLSKFSIAFIKNVER